MSGALVTGVQTVALPICELSIGEAGGLRAAVADTTRLCRAIGDVGCQIALRKLAGKHRRIVDVRIAERDIAGARFARGFLGRVLTRVEITRCLSRNRQRTTCHLTRSEERRVGTESVSTCRSRGSPYH